MDIEERMVDSLLSYINPQIPKGTYISCTSHRQDKSFEVYQKPNSKGMSIIHTPP